VLIFLGCLFGCVWIALCVKCKKQSSAQQKHFDNKKLEYQIKQRSQLESIKSMSSQSATATALKSPVSSRGEQTETTPPRDQSTPPITTPLHSAPSSPIAPQTPASPPSHHLVISMVPSTSEVNIDQNELQIPSIQPQIQNAVDSHIINESKHIRKKSKGKKKKSKSKSKSKSKKKKKHKDKHKNSKKSIDEFSNNYDYTTPAMRVSSLPNTMDMEQKDDDDMSSESDNNLHVGSAPGPSSHLGSDPSEFTISLRSGSMTMNNSNEDHSLHATAVIPQNHQYSKPNRAPNQSHMAMEHEYEYERKYGNENDYNDEYKQTNNKSRKHYRSRTTHSQKAAREQMKAGMSYLASPDVPSDAESIDVDEILVGHERNGSKYSKDGPYETQMERKRSRLSTATTRDDSHLNLKSHHNQSSGHGHGHKEEKDRDKRHKRKKSKNKHKNKSKHKHNYKDKEVGYTEKEKHLKTNREDILKVKKKIKNKKTKKPRRRRRASDVTDISAYSRDGDKSTKAYSDGDDDIYLVNEMEKVFAKNYDVIMMNKQQKQKQERQFSMNLANNLNEEKLIADDIINSMEIDIGSRPLSPLSSDTAPSHINDETNPIYAAYCGLE